MTKEGLYIMERGTLENIKTYLKRRKELATASTYSLLRLTEYILSSLCNRLEAGSPLQKPFLPYLVSMESYLGSVIDDILSNPNIWQQPPPEKNVE